MTRKDYELIARLVREGVENADNAATPQRQQSERAALWRFANNFAMEARADNPRFDRDRFVTACGFRTLQSL